MTEPLTFSGFPTEILVRNCYQIIPGIERCDGIFFHPPTQKLKLIAGRKDGDDVNLEDTDLELSEQINSLRRSRFGTEWLAKGEVPHLPLYQKKDAGSVFESELEKVVLLIKIPNQDDFLMDLVFIYDLSNLSLFGLSTNENLSASHKDIIAKLIFNSFKMLNFNYKNVHQSRVFLNEALIENSRKLAEERKTHLEIQTACQERIIEYCRYRLDGAGAKYHKKFFFDENAVSQIGQFKGKLYLLDAVIAQAASMANGLELSGKDIKIIESYLNFSISEPDHQQIAPVSTDEFSAEIAYLDKMEMAAIVALQQREKITGNNLTKYFGKDISFAAISGFIGKHSDNIRILLKKYPEKWPILRTEFMPIKKFIEPIKPSLPKLSDDEGLFEKTG